MKITKKYQPIYTINLSAEEMSKLWNILRESHHKGVDGAFAFYDSLEAFRPGGGFEECIIPSQSKLID